MELIEVKSLIWAQKGKLYIIKLESTDGQTVKVDFNPSSSKSSYQDLSEEERQKIKDLLFILDKFNVSENAKREPTVFCDGLTYVYN
jgi:hypothetical protein